MWRERAIRWGWAILILNASVALMNIGFGYGHYLKHEWLAMSASWSLTVLNGWVAYTQYTNVRKYKQELKDLMWETLSTPSEALR